LFNGASLPVSADAGLADEILDDGADIELPDATDDESLDDGKLGIVADD
jgi:hypothetical protein